AAGVVQADDNCTANVQIAFEERVEADSCAGSSRIVRLWTATDGCGNSATGMQTIQLVDDEAPVLTGGPSDTAIYLDMGQVVPLAALVSALDACTGATPVNYSEDTTAVTGCDYTLLRSWTATDACGNTAVQSQQIMVFGGTL